MLDEMDYKEPSCLLCDGKDFYYPSQAEALGRIEVRRILEKADAFFQRNDTAGAGRLLEYWKKEAISLRDKRGELAMENELVGFYRKEGDRDKALASVQRALVLVEELNQTELASGATVFLNCATAYKAFGMAQLALPLYEKAEAIYDKALSPGDERFGGLYNNMALALEDLGRFREAEKAYGLALGVVEEIPGKEPDVAISYVNLAHLYEKWGKEENCLPYMEKAYGLLKGKGIPRDGYYAFVLSKCAPSFGHFGQGEREEELKQEAERIYAGA